MPIAGGKTPLTDKRAFSALMIAIALLSAAVKIGLLMADVVPFNADEAVVGLMARHTLQGEWPTFFYGQAYMGSLDATLIALGFALFGSKVVVIRAVQIALYCGTIISAAYLAKLIFRSERVGILTAVIMAIPNVNTTLYTTVSLGGYGEALLIGNLLMISTIKIRRGASIIWRMLWGLLAGLGIWAFGLTLIYILPCLIGVADALVRKRRLKILATSATIIAMSALIGASPWVIWALRHGFSPLLEELLGSAISGASSPNYALAILSHGYYLLLFGTTVVFGLRPPWSVDWLALPLLPLALAFWLLVVIHVLRTLEKKEPAREGRLLLVGVSAALILGFIFTPFGADPSGRYFLPLTIPLSIFAADMVEGWKARVPQRSWVFLAPLLILAFNLYGMVEVAKDYPPGLTTQFDSVSWIDQRYAQALINFLEAEDERRGYTNYWVAYPLAFLSKEDLIFVPRLPYHEDFRYTARDNRYQPYDRIVEQSERVAYITTHHPALDAHLRESLKAAGISWKEERIGDYQIFYALSSVLRPDDLGIAELHVDHR